MVKNSTSGSRSGRKNRQKLFESGDEQRCPRHKQVCGIAVAATAFMWCVLLLSTWRVLEKDGPKMPDPNMQPVIKSLQSRIMTLEKELAQANEALVQKDQILAELRNVPKDSKQVVQTQQPEFVQKTKALQLRGSSGTTEPETTAQHGTCDFQENADYTIMGGRGKEELAKSNSNRGECCQLCQQRNRAALGSCTVAVLSSASDAPPMACWIKATPQMGVRIIGILKPHRKDGVVACFPPGHSDIPSLPPTLPPDTAILDHEKGIASLLPGIGPAARTNAIRDSIRHAWSRYKQLAWGMDELLPIAGRGRNRGFSLATTMVDSLDTLWLAGLRDEFDEAKDWLASNLPQKIHAVSNGVSVFETNIRVLGGLLSAHDLSKDKTFLDLADKLGRRILSTVNPRGITPYTFGGGRGGSGCPSLAESGTLQLEMRYLSHATGDDTFASKSMKFYETVQGARSLDGLWPNCFEKGKGKITFGADGDSFYEYLVKVWLQGGKRENESFLKGMYDKAVKGLQKHLVRKGTDGLSYLGTVTWDANSGSTSYIPEMEHLMCFVPGWLALGAQHSEDRATVMELADAIAYTCWQMYEQQPTGISPERVKGEAMDLSKTNTREYILRPEALEGWWYMLETTQDSKFREWGWRTFMAFEKWLWVPNGYASLKDVRATSKNYLDRMESFFIAETQKYLLLLQDPDHTMKLDRYVFNTEAHPLSILQSESS
ncbi:unnamed protein product [Durusdinium trenchii]|uniref:alpha-1,2-Mannosidase n=1 Tax=Durusdinium trenchii TaxID=1381693 RepID=A0ABP0JL73_9DINO